MIVIAVVQPSSIWIRALKSSAHSTKDGSDRQGVNDVDFSRREIPPPWWANTWKRQGVKEESWKEAPW